ncbi:MAG: outer membrane lipoprotein carrier protein LolA [Acetobacteraceae bacterium]|nr:outer membrane lipoprotein carrier protein LolA [Pseudomonadota bacterium]
MNTTKIAFGVGNAQIELMLTRRLALATAALFPFSLSAHAALDVRSPQDQADISRVEAYLNGLRTLKAQFYQVAPDGGISQGTAWVDRPGKMRFQYDPPAPFLLVAAHGVLTFNDSSLQQTTNVPLSRTPLGILLAENVALSGNVTVTAIQRLPGQLQMTLVRTDSPGDGSLTLIFTDQPLALRQWVVVDAQRRETHVTLTNIALGGRFDPALFEQLAPPAARKG